MKYKIWKCLIDEVEKELQKVEKKCKKHNCNFTYNIIEEVTEEVNGTTFTFVVIEVDGKAVINDYELIAITDFTENGNIIHALNDNEVPTRFRTTENYCEHCNSRRKRKQLFILKNINTNEYKQVGKSCVKLYTDGVDATRYLEMMECYHLLEEYNDMIPNNYMEYTNYKPMIKVEDVLNATIVFNEKIGYLSANGYNDVTTKYLVRCLLRKEIEYINRLLKGRFGVEIDEDDIDKDRAELINNIIEYYSDLEDNSDFIHNVKTLLKNKYIESNMVGYICYLPKGYERAMNKVEEQKMKQNINDSADYFGEVGKRYKGIKVDNIKELTNYMTDYGITTIYEIISNGNIFIWKSSKSFDNDFLKTVKTMDMTIKNHSEYKGIKQNNVTRCKLVA